MAGNQNQVIPLNPAQQANLKAVFGATSKIVTAKVGQLETLQKQLKEQRERTAALLKLQSAPNAGALNAPVAAAEIAALNRGELSLEQMEMLLGTLMAKVKATGTRLPAIFTWLRKHRRRELGAGNPQALPDTFSANLATAQTAAAPQGLNWASWLTLLGIAEQPANDPDVGQPTQADYDAVEALWGELIDLQPKYTRANSLHTALTDEGNGEAAWTQLSDSLRDMETLLERFGKVDKNMQAGLAGRRKALADRIKRTEQRGKQGITKKLLRKHFVTQVVMIFIALFDLLQTLLNALSEGESVDQRDLTWISLSLNIALLGFALFFLIYTLVDGTNSSLGHMTTLVAKFGALKFAKDITELAQSDQELDVAEERLTVATNTHVTYNPMAAPPKPAAPTSATPPATAATVTKTRQDEIKIDEKELLENIIRNRDFMKRIQREASQLGLVLLFIVLGISIATLGLNAWIIDHTEEKEQAKWDTDRISLFLLIIAVLKGTSTVLGGFSSQQKLADKEATAGKLYGELRELANAMRAYRELPSEPEMLKRIKALFDKLLASPDMKKLVGLLAAAPAGTVIPKPPTPASVVSTATTVSLVG